MGSQRPYASAWKDATLSFFDHIPALCLLIVAPAMVIGVIVHSIPLYSLASFVVTDSISSLILVVPGLAAALQMSRDETFYRPGMPPITQTLITRFGRLLVLGLLLILVLRPMLVGVFGILLAAAALRLFHPARWLDRGSLRDGRGSGGGLRLMLTATPLWLLSPLVLWAGFIGVAWSIENSTPLMCGLAYVLRGMAFVWCWTILFRLYRLRDVRVQAQAA